MRSWCRDKGTGERGAGIGEGRRSGCEGGREGMTRGTEDWGRGKKTEDGKTGSGCNERRGDWDQDVTEAWGLEGWGRSMTGAGIRV